MVSVFKYTKAICREIPKSIVTGGLKMKEPENPMSYELAVEQHNKYVSTLQNLGLQVILIPTDESVPDCCFVEDPAVVWGNRVLLTNLGHPSRQGETKAIGDIFEKLGMEVFKMVSPAKMDGGDVLFTGKEFFVGVSLRTNEEGIETLRNTFKDYPVHGIDVVSDDEVLHLKSMMTMAADNVIVIGQSKPAKRAQEQMQAKALHNYSFLEVPNDIAANCLFINGTLIHRTAEEFPDSIKVYETIKCPRIELAASEIGKVDGALSCCSLLLN